MKVERNSLCPCKSNIKYKKCCLRHPERSELAQDLNASYVDRDYVLSDLRSRSDTMSKFLESVPGPLLQNLWIFVDSNLTANMRSLIYDNRFVVITRQEPIAEEDFFDFAHELGHIILVLKGYPSCAVLSGDMHTASLASILTNTVMDPLVNKLVTQCDFDWDAYIEKSLRIQLPIIQSHPHDSWDDRHFLRCLCIEKILEWRILNIAAPNRFLSAFRDCHPSEYGYAVTFADRINDRLLEDPQYVRTVLSQLIRDNQMEGVITLV